MARQIAMRIRSDEIGKELVRVIKEECELPLGLKLWRFGRIEANATPEKLSDLFPAVLVIPDSVEYTPSTVNQANFDVLDRYRIVYAVPLPKEKDPLPFAIDGLRLIGDALGLDSSLAELAQRIGNDQIWWSIPEGVEYDPDEDGLLRQQVEVKAVVLRWVVKWTTC